MKSEAVTESSVGYGFAAFRSHELHRIQGDWYAPERSYQAGDGYHAPCACGRGFYVSQFQHYHGYDGICHNLERCHER